MNKPLPLIAITAFIFVGCKHEVPEGKMNQIDLTPSYSEDENYEQKEHGYPTKPNTVIVTGNSSHKLVTIYKEKFSKDGKIRFIDGNYYHYNYMYDVDEGNNWNGNYMPGLEAVYGYKMYNVAHLNADSNQRNNFFDHPVLVKTLYYPTDKKDTLNFEPITRDYYMVSVYDEDTNNDTIINHKDLRRFYWFDINGKNKTPLVPKNYSVFKSEYDPKSDLMYVFAQLDENENGKRDPEEHIHVFYFSLADPKPAERVY